MFASPESDAALSAPAVASWWKREIGKAPVGEWDEHRREVLKKDFKLVLEIYEEL